MSSGRIESQGVKKERLKMTPINIGTSGWSYRDWVGSFYPENTKSRDFLDYYSGQFDTVEVNSSFYHTLKDKTVENWINEVPDRFVFAVKADKYITHIKKLREPSQTVPDFMKSVAPFKNKLGPILFQLPPSLDFDAERLDAFIRILPEDYSYVFEFRNKNWFNNETCQILRKRNIALCIYNLKGFQSPFEVTANFVYIRFHGTEGIGIGKYNKEDIEKLSLDIKKSVSENKNVYCYFNNGTNGAAIANARELKEKLVNQDNRNSIFNQNRSI